MIKITEKTEENVWLSKTLFARFIFTYSSDGFSYQHGADEDGRTMEEHRAISRAQAKMMLTRSNNGAESEVEFITE